MLIEVAASFTPVALKVTEPTLAVAVSVFAPAVWPSFQLATVATPLPLVVALVPVAEPPPEATAKVMATPETGFPYWSLTRTDGAVARLWSTTADWPSPALIVSAPAESARALAWAVTTPPPAGAGAVVAP